jgi:hypothetical protein
VLERLAGYPEHDYAVDKLKQEAKTGFERGKIISGSDEIRRKHEESKFSGSRRGGKYWRSRAGLIFARRSQAGLSYLEEDVAPPFARFRKRSTRRRWRRARVMDLAATELRKLIDFRLKPQFQAPPSHVEQLSSSAQLSVGIEPANGDARVSAH